MIWGYHYFWKHQGTPRKKICGNQILEGIEVGIIIIQTYLTCLLLPCYLTWHTIWTVENKISPGRVNPAKPHQKKTRAAASSSPMALRLRPSCRAKNLQWIGKNCLMTVCNNGEQIDHGDQMMLQMNMMVQMVMVTVIAMMMTMKILERIKHVTKIVTMIMILIIQMIKYLYTRDIFSTRTAHEFVDNYLWQYMIRIMILTTTMISCCCWWGSTKEKRKNTWTTSSW